MFIGELILYIQCLSVWSVALWTSDERICPTNDWILIDVSCEIVVYSARPGPAAVIPSSRDAQTPQLAARWRHKSIFPSVARSVGRTDSLSDGPRSRCGTKLPRSLLTLRQYSSTAAPVSVPRAAILSIRLSLSLSVSLPLCMFVCVCVRVCVWCQDHRVFVTCTAID